MITRYTPNRYDLCDDCSNYDLMIENENGEYIRYEDVAETVRELLGEYNAWEIENLNWKFEKALDKLIRFLQLG